MTGSPSTRSRRAPSRSAHVTSSPSSRESAGCPLRARPSRRRCRRTGPTSLRWPGRRRASRRCAGPRLHGGDQSRWRSTARRSGTRSAAGPTRCRRPGRRARRCAATHRRSACRRTDSGTRRVAAPDSPDRRCGSGRTSAVSALATAIDGAVGTPPEPASRFISSDGRELGIAPADGRGSSSPPATNAPRSVELGDAERVAVDVRDALGERDLDADRTPAPSTANSRASPPSRSATNSRPASANAASVKSLSTAYDVMPPADSLARSRRRRSSSGRSSSPPSSSGPASSSSGIGDESFVAGRGVDDPQPVDRIGAARAAQERDRRPSLDTVTVRGSPSVNRCVRADSLGNDSDSAPAPARAPGPALAQARAAAPGRVPARGRPAPPRQPARRPRRWCRAASTGSAGRASRSRRLADDLGVLDLVLGRVRRRLDDAVVVDVPVTVVVDDLGVHDHVVLPIAHRASI